jgi:hypothetical protein
MARITALLHTENDVLRLGRSLETLYPCDEILIVDHGSGDGTVRVAQVYGARVVAARAGASPNYYLRTMCADWILCLDPRESLTESLAASLFEWKSVTGDSSAQPVRSVFIREETKGGWVDRPEAETRLVPQSWGRWRERFPIHEPTAITLDGELLRFAFP